MMKEKLLSRLDKLEEALREETVVPMVAEIYNDGSYDWNGVHYKDSESLHEAMTLICGSHPRTPLLIINRHHDIIPSVVQ